MHVIVNFGWRALFFLAICPIIGIAKEDLCSSYWEGRFHYEYLPGADQSVIWGWIARVVY